MNWLLYAIYLVVVAVAAFFFFSVVLEISEEEGDGKRYLGIDETQQVTCVMIALHGLPVAFGVSGIGMGVFFWLSLVCRLREGFGEKLADACILCTVLYSRAGTLMMRSRGAEELGCGLAVVIRAHVAWRRKTNKGEGDAAYNASCIHLYST